ncbi:bifunctional lytic transglycosylase/amino acid ABC transporter substrate-binding protein [Pseudomonas cavernicola]|uniref:Bifunctional lytic transglycosylase/amino acid ABC transporter substrate-binding protein n=1 Tax=Pseudomonas cavernicola TaxID=2320866 RepID=A0A418XJG8_9PSED|nr:transporter substrate-binding domain-containing protein [Pseudomonas cavernicola]RJG12581.1 bifunctional lytic transglycosylase/amino acid ABC transporter substrate-binding protein [Pseudomonas cavernicola]
MSLFRRCLLVLLLSLAQAQAEDQAVAPVRVGFLEFPPYSYLDTLGSPAGSMIDFAERLFELAGLPVEMTPYPPARLYKNLQDGSTEVTLGAVGNPMLREHTLNGSEVIGSLDLNLYYPAGQAPPQLPQDLIGKRLLLIHGFTYWAPEARKLLEDQSLGLILQTTHRHLAAIEMLDKRRTDYLLDYQMPVEEALQQSQRPALPALTLHSLPLGLIFSRHSMRSELLRQRLEGAYQQLKDSGELQEWRRAMRLHSGGPRIGTTALSTNPTP